MTTIYTNTSFDFNSIPAEKPASYKQIQYRVGNPAVAYLFAKLDLKSGTYKATNYKLFSQMPSAIKTATLKHPLTNGDVRAIDKGLTKAHLKMFNNAFRELYLEPNDLSCLLLKDGLSAEDVVVVISKYCNITGKSGEIKLPQKTVLKKTAKVMARTKVKSDKPLKISTGKGLTDEQKADKIAMLQEQMETLLNSI